MTGDDKDPCQKCEEHICNPCMLRDLLEAKLAEARKLLREIHMEISQGTTMAGEAWILGRIERYLDKLESK